MRYKYELPGKLVNIARSFSEFANGGAQATIKLKSGQIFSGALISNSSAIIALRGYKDLPFQIAEIECIFQTEQDKNPTRRGCWDFWDKW